MSEHNEEALDKIFVSLLTLDDARLESSFSPLGRDKVCELRIYASKLVRDLDEEQSPDFLIREKRERAQKIVRYCDALLEERLPKDL